MSHSLKYFYLLSALLFLQCKQNIAPDTKSNTNRSQPFDSILKLNTGSELDTSANYFFYLFRTNFIKNINDPLIPLEISVSDEKKPYSGHWYPQKAGGTNVILSDGFSPLQKYDRVFNSGKSLAADWEMLNHGPKQKEKLEDIPNWAGHCNGYSAASSNRQEPNRDVTKNGVVFRPHDIKALLAEVYMNVKYLFLAGNRCLLPLDRNHPEKFPSALNRKNPTIGSACDDTNAATFHTVLTNWIARANQAIVVDISPDNAVWNYPHYAYRFTKAEVDREAALKIIGSGEKTYVFNPDAKKFFDIHMTAFYANAPDEEALGSIAPHLEPHNSKYRYVLETDVDGFIVGGEWARESQTAHPAFVWAAFEILPGNGSKDSSNPNVNSDKVLKLWAKSIGADENNLPDSLKEPVWENNWGKFKNFTMQIDGLSRGVVFLDKKNTLTLQFEGTAIPDQSGIELDIDGVSAAKGKKAAAVFAADIVTTPGLHRLVIRILDSKMMLLEKQSINFYVIP